MASDRWLPRPYSFKILSPNRLQEDALVDELMLGKGLWNEGLIKENFWPVDADFILQIPLSIVNQYDSLVWHFDKNEEYTVKSEYKAAMKYKE